MIDEVFVCYSRKDEDFVLTIASKLRDSGVPLWLDQWSIAPGDDWDRCIEEALSRCPQFLIVLSPNAIESTEVRGELRAALDQRKRIIPVLYKRCSLPRQLRNTHYIDFSYSTGSDPSLAMALLAALSGKPVRSLRGSSAKYCVRRLAAYGAVSVTAAVVILIIVITLFDPRQTCEPAAGGREGIPEFLTRYLEEPELAGKSPRELTLMRNEIFARCGWWFDRTDLREYFIQRPWYTPKYRKDEFLQKVRLTRVQDYNAQLILNYQKKHGLQY